MSPLEHSSHPSSTTPPARRPGARRLFGLSAAAALLWGAGACEFPPQDTEELGFRGTGMVHIANPAAVADSQAAVEARVPSLPAEPDPDMEPAPPGTWENVQYLGHLSEAEFNRTMLAMTTWVAQGTGQGCNYCHVVNDQGQADYVSDDIYTKVVSRDMIRMTQQLNAEYSSHVGDRGINCWTCHQGEVLPNNYWFFAEEGPRDLERLYVNEGDRQSERYFLDQENIRVVSTDAALTGDTDNVSSIQDTRHAYWVMTQMSEGLGVNCTYCHQSPRFSDWEESPPQRVTALRGARMLRHANTEYMVPLQDAWPENRLGPRGDGPKLQCATCHNGAPLPQYGNEAGYGIGWPALTVLGPPHDPVAGPDAEIESGGGGTD